VAIAVGVEGLVVQRPDESYLRKLRRYIAASVERLVVLRHEALISTIKALSLQRIF
jgi:hypothetical protein